MKLVWIIVALLIGRLNAASKSNLIQSGQPIKDVNRRLRATPSSNETDENEDRWAFPDLKGKAVSLLEHFSLRAPVSEHSPLKAPLLERPPSSKNVVPHVKSITPLREEVAPTVGIENLLEKLELEVARTKAGQPVIEDSYEKAVKTLFENSVFKAWHKQILENPGLSFKQREQQIYDGLLLIAKREGEAIEKKGLPWDYKIEERLARMIDQARRHGSDSTKSLANELEEIQFREWGKRYTLQISEQGILNVQSHKLRFESGQRNRWNRVLLRRFRKYVSEHEKQFVKNRKDYVKWRNFIAVSY